ncbi:DUF3618 domain-containing protein [Corynebacterium pyruviciproducens]|uniref:DUF3618 domain-containing protein n=2 Tax=Corynebacterium pyruviciproducens TaxID=598660 RepID=S2YYN6_9CORY|nr:DUF3618 domain-containing protein [Corynebacterium pyruviciproducens]EPD69381.1 hypothetical protein HMPREF1219_01252 [Corynebacterium pyruviciproducens ATCC BAA-1742]MDH4659066.1 DUF3618 domain-containing protein [Corynebacterium pyruviciproducens]MDK6566956.1 DUF3618 domain-containing protein [Corynebacterium pyruviciproducens]MDK7215185.1 DUF3618 domain-containing protein [Corynebacterium pyruviciproducens]WOT02692.1 DUF3618 domain-containing protein [Corynebacterium pyruviciproducens]
MARSLDDIQADIDRTRAHLASTLDQLASKTKPEALVDDTKAQLTARVKDPQVQAILGVAGAVVVVGIIASLVRGSRKRSELKRLTQWLEDK